jgi:hypothetical protein
VINTALKCQGKEKSINAELIHNIAESTFSRITWNQQFAQQSLQEILKLFLYPESMLMLYQNLVAHNQQHNQAQHAQEHKVSLELDLDSFECAIKAYQSLQMLKTPTQNESMSSLINKNGIFNSYKSQEKTLATTKLLFFLEVKLANACKAHPQWPNDFLEQIFQLPWPLCEIFMPYLIICNEIDSLGNTLLHQLSKHPECSPKQFEEILKKIYKHSNSTKQWNSYITSTNKDGDDAAKVAFSVGRFEICKLLYRYSLYVEEIGHSPLDIKGFA